MRLLRRGGAGPVPSAGTGQGFVSSAASVVSHAPRPVGQAVSALSFETKPPQPIEYINETGRSMSVRNGSKLAFLERPQLAFEV